MMEREREMDDYLPPGFRFYPTEEELVSFYLHNKLEGRRDDLNRAIDRIIPVLDIYHFNPWDLPQLAGEVCRRDQEQWFFFIPRQESEARGGRPKRLTTTGYWKATGSPSYVYSSNHRSIGVKRTMVFYNGRAPTGTKTVWKMNEYKAIHAAGGPSSSSSSTTVPQLSLCRIYKKTKSLRAFDRRPPPPQEVEMAQIPADQQVTQHNVGDQFVDQKPNPPLMEERASSPESCSSGDHGDAHHLSHTTGSEVTSMQPSGMNVDDDELVWDWNHLNWL